jgi:hypothetical protein
MMKRRATFFSFTYKNQIWVLGGYTNPYKRSRCIEKYNEKLNAWERISFKLNRGIEAGIHKINISIN